MSLRCVKLSEKQKRELASYLLKLKKLNVTEVYLFGSRVHGVPFEDSDLDIIVVSEEFGKRSFIENMQLLSELWDGSFTIEAFPYTPEQIRKYKGRKVTVTEALEKGIRIEL
ncbi:MAG: nucleotidyltransferase domain-containing protein [Candidatus Jordarchaeales archaeon]